MRAGAGRLVTTASRAVWISRLVVLALSGAWPSVTSAQQRDSTAHDRWQRTLDSLAARLARTDSALTLLQQQVATEAASGVRLRSRLQLDLSARLVVHASGTRGGVSAAEIPVFATPARAAGGGNARPQVFGMSMRQALLGGSASMDSVAGATLLADFELDFFARALDASPPLFPEPRLRTARVFLVWPRTEVLLGMETPLIADLNPVSTAGVAIPLFAAAGNLWNWLPQLRVTRTLATRGEWAMAAQGAVLSPNASERPLGATSGGADLGQASGRPALQSRVRLRHGTDLDERAAQAVWTSGMEIGVGAHAAWLRTAPANTLRSWAIAADVHAALGHGVEVRGEAYRGALVRGRGGGGSGQNFGTLGVPAGGTGPPLTGTAGWLQLNGQWHPSLVHGMGCGTDRVHGAGADRRRNGVCALHTTWRPAMPLFVSLEYRRLRTRYADGLWRAQHWNLAFGVDL